MSPFLKTLAAAAALTLSPLALAPAAHAQTDVSWYSEQVKVVGRLHAPATAGKHPAVILAPGWGQTAATMETYAKALAEKGVIALAIDYRGWGKSGGFIYLGERIDTYDLRRVSDQTANLVIRRGRLDPEQQVQDIRNAITFLQGRDNVDQTKIGVLGVGMSGGHVIQVMGMDARAKSGVAITPVIAGGGETPKSYIPTTADRALLVKYAREALPRNKGDMEKRNADEARLSLLEYKPFWRIPGIPESASVRFIVAGADKEVDNAKHALAASKALKASNDVQTLPNAGHKLTAAEQTEAAKLAADFISQKLK